MPHCYLLAVASASSLDQQSNNVSLFNLVEQVNVPPGAPPPPGGLIPLEVHAYFQLAPVEVGQPFDVRFAMTASTGLETFSEVFTHRSATPRYRTRIIGLPFPPVPDQYQLHLDWRSGASDSWTRAPAAWPMLITELVQRPTVTH